MAFSADSWPAVQTVWVHMNTEVRQIGGRVSLVDFALIEGTKRPLRRNLWYQLDKKALTGTFFFLLWPGLI